jgi:hypothetical protein
MNNMPHLEVPFLLRYQLPRLHHYYVNDMMIMIQRNDSAYPSSGISSDLRRNNDGSDGDDDIVAGVLVAAAACACACA